MTTLEELDQAYSFLRDPILKKAIDRIMRLESALEILADPEGWECCSVSQTMRQVAANALKEGET